MVESDKRDLQPPRRLITSHNRLGQGIFVSDDSGDHQRMIMGGKSAASVMYSTSSLPIDMNDEVDLAFARNNEVNSFSYSRTISSIS